jgi:hypothetical protein
MNKYTFIQPTKTGGTSIGQYFNNYYSTYITSNGHNTICKNDNNPIIVVRDVSSRFLSMYKYWNNGTIDKMYNCDDGCKKKHKNFSFSILEFIDILKKNKSQLYHCFIWSQHFDNTTTWIENTDYKNIIIIRYETDLNEKIQKLINILGIPNQNIPLPKINVSISIDNEHELNDPDVNEFIEEYFKNDIILFNSIQNNPELFKLVI